ncbi:unnamed protein product [Rotaria magnacalcarata]|uniref:Uncharacterized protein n=1 Tax=Rotaria magnacalcarata TaxID=392030 RepID=A0A819K911_9BILA|nr:unnamed protein product [Rotaria magnacalcarata]
MTCVSLDISRLPHDVLKYLNQRFFDFIESFYLFLFVQDVYSIFAVDSEDAIEIQLSRDRDENKNRKNEKTAFVSTPSIVSIPSTVSTASSYLIKSSPGDTAIIPFVSTKNVAEHHEFITTFIEQWWNQNKNDLNLLEVICSCGLKSSLARADSGNFRVSNYFRHLKTTCSIVQSQSIDNSTEHEQIRSNIVISRDSSLLLSAQQPSTVSTLKRA